MKNLRYIDCESLANYIVDLVNEDKGTVVYTLVKYEKARALLKELAIFDKTKFEFIDLNDAEYDGYDSLYYVIFDSNYNVSVEKAWHEANNYHPAGYYRFDATYFIIDKEDYESDFNVMECVLNDSCKVKIFYVFIDDEDDDEDIDDEDIDDDGIDDLDDDFDDEDEFDDEDDDDDECCVNLTRDDIETVKDLIHSLLDFAFDNI